MRGKPGKKPEKRKKVPPMFEPAGPPWDGFYSPTTPTTPTVPVHGGRLEGRRPPSHPLPAKRPLPPCQETSTPASAVRRRKPAKVSRACDLCKARKSKCDGMIPCDKCVAKGHVCLYDAKYSRGRPPTPPPSTTAMIYATPAYPVHREEQRNTPPTRRSKSSDIIPPPHASEGSFNLQPPPSAIAANTSAASLPVLASNTTSTTMTSIEHGQAPDRDEQSDETAAPQPRGERNTSSRQSPDLGMEEIQGQVFDPTSTVTFLHRAWKRLSKQNGREKDNADQGPLSPLDQTPGHQPWMFAGDKPLSTSANTTEFQSERNPDLGNIVLPDHSYTRELVQLYFDVCIATYRFLHRGTTEAWLDTLEANLHEGKPIWNKIGKSRAAIVLVVLAISATHLEKLRRPIAATATSTPSHYLSRNNNNTTTNPEAHPDELFGMAMRLVDTETGIPRLELAQAHLILVLYLLTTSRMNRAWYVFGNLTQIVGALGLHRRGGRNRRVAAAKADYIQSQCAIRLFWAAYIIDGHLSVIFGRSRHYHDDDIDQEFPASINDEYMTTKGPIDARDEFGEGAADSLIEALVYHAK